LLEQRREKITQNKFKKTSQGNWDLIWALIQNDSSRDFPAESWKKKSTSKQAFHVMGPIWAKVWNHENSTTMCKLVNKMLWCLEGWVWVFRVFLFCFVLF
jgi:hypothetical protein